MLVVDIFVICVLVTFVKGFKHTFLHHTDVIIDKSIEYFVGEANYISITNRVVKILHLPCSW